jgi:hypothetical protein
MQTSRRRAMRVPMCSVCVAGFLCAVLGTAPSVGAAQAQNNQSMSPLRTQNPNNLPSQDGRDPNAAKDPLQAQMEAKRFRSAATERQKKMMDDTAKLLQLATELKENVDKTTKDEMSLDVIRKAEEIEKLAHDVKLRMKG